MELCSRAGVSNSPDAVREIRCRCVKGFVADSTGWAPALVAIICSVSSEGHRQEEGER